MLNDIARKGAGSSELNYVWGDQGQLLDNINSELGLNNIEEYNWGQNNSVGKNGLRKALLQGMYREGKTPRQIADALGVSLDEAKAAIGEAINSYETGDKTAKSLTEAMTDYDLPSNKVSASSYWHTANNFLHPWKMFDKDLNTYWIASGDGEQWVEYQFDYTVFVLESIWMRAVYNSARQLENLKVEVSNNGIDYITVWQKDVLKTKANEEYAVPINYISDDGFDRVKFTTYKECENQNYYVGIQEARIYGSIEPQEMTKGIVIDMTKYYTKSQVDDLLRQVANGTYEVT